MEILSVTIEKPEEINFVLGQSHFIKTVEDVHEALISSVDKFITHVEDENFPAPITKYTGTLFYDWNTGQLLYDEGWVTLADGTHLLMDKKELVVLPGDQVPDEVLFSFD